jgi:hypothetical protein
MGPLPLIAAKHQSAGPENVLPQWQQKIFIRPYQSFVAEGIFRTKCDFLQVLDLLIFRIERRAIEAQRLQSIFT